MTTNSHGGGGGNLMSQMEKLLDSKFSLFEARLCGIEKLLATSQTNGNAPPSPLHCDLEALFDRREQKMVNHLREVERQINDHVSLTWDHKEITAKVCNIDERLDVILSGEGEVNALVEKMLPSLDIVSEQSRALEKEMDALPARVVKQVVESPVIKDIVRKLDDIKDYTKDCLDTSEDVLKKFKCLEKQHSALDVSRALKESKKDVYDVFCDVIDEKVGQDLVAVRNHFADRPGKPSRRSPPMPRNSRSRTPSRAAEGPVDSGRNTPAANSSPHPPPLPVVSPVPAVPSIPTLLATELEVMSSGVAEIQDQMESWLKYSKKTLNKSDDNTESLMTKLTSTQGLISEFQTAVKEELDVLKAGVDETKNSGASLTLLLSSTKENASKIDDVLNRVKSNEKTFKSHVNSYQDNTLKILKLIKEIETVARGIAQSKEKEDHFKKISQSLDELRNSIHSPKKESSSSTSLVTSDESQFQLQRISDVVVDIRDLLVKPPTSSSEGGQLGELHRVLEEVKNCCEAHQKGELQCLGELKSESVKMGKALSEMAKSKLGEKSLSKLAVSVDSLVKNASSEAKMLALINTTVQGLKSSGSDSRHGKEILKSIESVKQHAERTTKEELQDIKTQLVELNLAVGVGEGRDNKKAVGEEIAKLQKGLQSVEKKISEQTKTSNSELKKTLVDQLNQFQQKSCEQISKEQRAAATDVKKCLVDYELQTQKKVVDQCAKLSDELLSHQGQLQGQLNETKKGIMDAFSESGKSSPGRKKVSKNASAGESPEEEASLVSIKTNLSKIVGEVSKQTLVASEILNSVEDMKQLHSAMPNTLHDEVIPSLEQLGSAVAAIPTEGFMAALEENLCNNLAKEMKTAHQSTLQEIFPKFESLETKLAIVKKYAKYGYGNDKASGSGTSTPVGKTPPVSSGSGDVAGAAQLMQHVSQQCQELGTLLDSSRVMSQLDSQIKELLSIDRQILSEQAKGLVVEEQLEASTHTVLKGIDPTLKKILDAQSTRYDTSKTLPVIKRMEQVLKKLEELECSRQEQRVVETRNNPLVRSPNTAQEADGPIKYLDGVKKLVSYLTKVQASQKEILSRTDQTIEFQTGLNDAVKKLVQTMETIRSDVKDPDSLGYLPDLCLKFQKKMEALDHLESNLSAPKSQDCEDLRRVIQKSMDLLNHMIKDQGKISTAHTGQTHKSKDDPQKQTAVAAMVTIEEEQVEDLVSPPFTLSTRPNVAAQSFEPVMQESPFLNFEGSQSNSSTHSSSSSKRHKRKSAVANSDSKSRHTDRGFAKKCRLNLYESDGEGEFDAFEEVAASGSGSGNGGVQDVPPAYKDTVKPVQVRIKSLSSRSLLMQEASSSTVADQDTCSSSASSTSTPKAGRPGGRPGPASMTGRAKEVPESKKCAKGKKK